MGAEVSASPRKSRKRLGGSPALASALAVVVALAVGTSGFGNPNSLGAARAQSGRHGAETTHDLTGSWIIINEITSSSYQPYVGNKLGFDLELRQEGRLLIGEAVKTTWNGQAVRPAERSRLRLEGTVRGDEVDLSFREFGPRRTIDGTFVWEIAPDGDFLVGRFTSDAGGSSGASQAVRVD